MVRAVLLKVGEFVASARLDNIQGMLIGLVAILVLAGGLEIDARRDEQ